VALLNRVRMSITGNPGTGPVTVNAALPRYQSAIAAGAANGAKYSYSLEEGDAKAENGRATYNAGVFTRNEVFDSTAGYGVKETFSSNAVFAITVLSQDISDLEKRAANKATGLALVMGG